MLETENTPLIALHGIDMYHNGEMILDHINLSVSQNEIVTLIGPNGAGKSTLIKIALGLTQPTGGSLKKQKDIRIGYVPQSINLDETLPVTVHRFLTLSGPEYRKGINRMLDLVGAGNLRSSVLSEISGGEMRRVLLARALLSRPNLLILDEPTSGVDINGQSALYSLIQKVRDEFHCGVLLASHDLHIVMAATDKVICLNKQLCCSGTPEHVQRHPEFVALFGLHNATQLGFYHHQHGWELNDDPPLSTGGTSARHPHG